MFKQLFVSSLLALSYAAQAQTTPAGPLPVSAETHHITYTGVVEVPGATKDELYTRATEWFAKTYNNANSVLQMQDRAAGQLVGKPVLATTVRSLGSNYPAGIVKYTISLYLKDGKYKYEITDFVHDATGSKLCSAGPLENEKTGCMSLTKGQWTEIKSQTDRAMQGLVASMSTTLSKKAASDF
ncbi:DUF4468 domain-containing protein [Hymenobacter cheonanensis]|uniref:DUF4468 domain-containing protein n=1 Tax=Hymenobacter sp. CA2-7 TaxID=3063993 RepID=UPI0027139AE9|nr:DUF4468 domain-containing protein [Hymenobacter sp. CA2-7]MDO7885316.1 DUF4468 domain-containing protein [Hymenobacter sp. CA2-7]